MKQQQIQTPDALQEALKGSIQGTRHARKFISKFVAAIFMSNFIPIYYRGFWDVPHAFYTSYKNEIFLFWRDYFDEELDDYPPNYEVYRIENMPLEKALKIWELSELNEKEFVGEISTKDVIFDETKRKFINCI